ncbi:MAG: minor capsid protein [Faecalibacterium sp.]|nr:minor capsid protein [Ruminococcus sp.]MCM1392263.1 minor capsid protein [Ruminococcus sp.]MCM1485949.1 minor capsid protein [Faecalibacterium sp.]
MANEINQPKDVKIKQMKAEVDLAWSQTFGRDRSLRIDNAQKFVDSECIRLMVPYTPALNDILYKSVTLGTKIGSGELIYLSSYARFQYYGKLMVSSLTGSPFSHGESKVLTDIPLNYTTMRHPLAGAFWFERMKADKLEAIKRGAAKYAGGTPE